MGTEETSCEKSTSSCSRGETGNPSVARSASADSGGAVLPDEKAVLPLRLPLLPVEEVEGYMTLRIGK